MPRRPSTPYPRLGDHLAACREAGETRATFTFAEIEALIGRGLPVYGRTPGGVRHRWPGGEGQVHAWEGWARLSPRRLQRRAPGATALSAEVCNSQARVLLASGGRGPPGR